MIIYIKQKVLKKSVYIIKRYMRMIYICSRILQARSQNKVIYCFLLSSNSSSPTKYSFCLTKSSTQAFNSSTCWFAANSLDYNWEIRASKSLLSHSIIINWTFNASFYVSKFCYSFSNLSFLERTVSCFLFNSINSHRIFTKLSFNLSIFSLYCSTLFINL